MSTWDAVKSALMPFNLKTTGSDAKGNERWRCNDPFRPGSDSMAIALLIHPDGEHGAVYDHRDAQSDSLYTLAEKLGIPLPQTTDVGTSKRVYESGDDYARGHGAEWHAFDAAGWEYTIEAGRPALRFPVGPVDNRQYRFRFLDGNKPAFLSPDGFKPCWYGLRRAAVLAETTGLPIFIVNGEPSVVVAQYWDIPAIAGAGMGERANGLPDYMLSELRSAWKGPYALVPDCDEVGAKYAKAVAGQLPDLLVPDLGLSKGGDICDFCRLYGPEDHCNLHDPKPLDALKRRMIGAPAVDGSLTMKRVVDIAMQNAAKWHKDPKRVRGLRTGFTPIDEQYGGLMDDDLLILMAASNVGKSTVVTQMGITLAAQAEGGFVTSEMYPWWAVQRMASMRAGVEIRRVWDGTLKTEEWLRFTKASEDLSVLKIHWYNKAIPSPQDLVEFARMHPGMKWIIVDSMNNISAGESGDTYGNLRATIDAFQVIRNMGIRVIATLQDKPMSNTTSPNEEPNPYNAYGGASPYQFATRFLTMWRPGFHAKGNDMNRTIFRSWKDRYFGATNTRWSYKYTGYSLEPEDMLSASEQKSLLINAIVNAAYPAVVKEEHDVSTEEKPEKPNGKPTLALPAVSGGPGYEAGLPPAP